MQQGGTFLKIVSAAKIQYIFSGIYNVEQKERNGMGGKYIFRFDDIAPNMDWGNYEYIKSIFDKYDVKPLIGVIPDNQDPELQKYAYRDEDYFWNEMRKLQRNGWEIALHGYQHKYVTKEAGIFGINNKSEFSGLPIEVQNEKIKNGMRLFNSRDIKTDTFMAPSHSLDRNTLLVLKENGIHTITDGFALYPYYYEDLLFVPQLFATQRRMPFGIYTFCIHFNTMTKASITEIEDFIKLNRDDIITFSEAKAYATKNPINKLSGTFFKSSLSVKRGLQNI
ncbi:DUF2334 domain-containing protein [Planomicrobium sp. CPCC 101110]|uniref:DUF2334 domain-containing protein n=1 Tax=Planomicrobium sp. CPCC 101110 TaxID=2599619 RepID=UPI0011B6F0F4|nr:DUF2334 domain-containing protein [Planomicrobium sp. CPCC 101110]TWT27767.1 DUF2334 domain-containing protein [Planomicrobium sp. CPCC 101110]